MTQTWRNNKVIGVTKVIIEPCVITQVKREERDGYTAVQVGTGVKKEKRIKKPQIGHFKKVKEVNKDINSNFRYLKEFKLDEIGDLKIGDQIDINTFEKGDKVQVTSVSKGKGFQGVVKRHGFAGGDKSHGNKDQLRMPGSIGATGPAHVFKGMRMAGRTGGNQVTIKNLEIVEVDAENNILLIKGSISGAKNSLVLISGKGDIKLVESNKNKEVKPENKTTDKKINEPKKEENIAEKKTEVEEKTEESKKEDNKQSKDSKEEKANK